MPVLFRCSTCERTLSTARRKTGMEIICPGCQSPVRVEPLEVLLIVRKPESGGPDISVWPAQAEMPVPPDTDNLTLNNSTV